MACITKNSLDGLNTEWRWYWARLGNLRSDNQNLFYLKNKEKRDLENRLCDMWNSIKHSCIWVNGTPKGKNERMGQKKNIDNVMAENSLNQVKIINLGT